MRCCSVCGVCVLLIRLLPFAVCCYCCCDAVVVVVVVGVAAIAVALLPVTRKYEATRKYLPHRQVCLQLSGSARTKDGGSACRYSSLPRGSRLL